MTARSRPLGALAAALALAISAIHGCYRAEFDVSSLLDESAQGSGGESGSGGGSCDATPLDPDQLGCKKLLPSRQECSEQDVSGWSGCYDGGCSVCTKSVREYPYYFDWHPCCSRNDTCNSNPPTKCNARCPEPTDHDRVKPCFVIDEQ